MSKQIADHLFYHGNQQNLTPVQSIKMSTQTPIRVLNSILSFPLIQFNLNLTLDFLSKGAGGITDT